MDHAKIEKKWQQKWREEEVYWPKDMSEAKNNYYNLWMFPYPSAEGLHAGHAFASTGSDIYGRYQRMKGNNVFQPIGYDSFGIHSENFAIKIGEHPKNMLDRTTQYYANQLQSLGHGYDWTRTVTTSDKDYYQWTQWLFIQIFKAGLAYRKKASVNWCPSCKTVLADEQVTTPAQAGKIPKDANGNEIKEVDVMVCERCGSVVEKKELEQWFFRITDYADKLLENLDKIDWPDKIKTAQKNWIGKKEGINITYPIKGSNENITVWTSRPDTNFGATFIVVSPEFAHQKLLDLIDKEHKSSVHKYIKTSLNTSKDDRIAVERQKTGVFTGLYATNQLNDYELPIWVADFVLSDVGTGAVVGVPGHDLRDFEFAQKFDLPIKRVVVGPDDSRSEITSLDQVQEEEGFMVNSDFLNGMDIHKATQLMMDHLVNKGWGERVTNYHLRDWLISRQRYWGPPIPMIYCGKCAENNLSFFEISENIDLLHVDQSDWNKAGWFPAEDLPVELPYLEDFKPKGEGVGPLANHLDFYITKCPNCGEEAKRETDVSDTFLDSAWYFLAYPMQNAEVWKKGPAPQEIGSHSSRKTRTGGDLFDNKVIKSWLPVDLYFGGAEHAVLHLMYARFVTMLLDDLNYIDFDEPFPRFFAHGLMIKDGAKMSKSKGNVVNPDKYIEKFGADTLRLYLMFMGPMDGYPDFRDTGIEGMRRFVNRVWDLYKNHSNIVVNDEDLNISLNIKLHQTIKKVSEEIEKYQYNTSIAAMMELINEMREATTTNGVEKVGEIKKSGVWYEMLSTLALLLAPFAPHMTEEVWSSVLGQQFSIHTQPWPEYDKNAINTDEVEIIVQINGKTRGTIVVDREKSMQKDTLIELAKDDQNISKWLKEVQFKDIIFVPGRLLNFVSN